MNWDQPPKIWMPQKPAIIRPADDITKANFLPGMFPGMVSAPTAPALPSRTYLDRGENTSTLSTYTFSSFSLGSADATRRVVVGINGANGGGNNRTIDSVTVAGASATIVVQANSSGRRVGLAIADVPAGTSGDIVVTFSGTESTCVVWAWAAYNLSSATAVNTGSATFHFPSLDLSLNTSADGLAFGCSFTAANGSATWTGLTEDNDATLSSQGRTAASLQGTPASTPLSVTCEWSSASQTVGVTASFR